MLDSRAVLVSTVVASMGAATLVGVVVVKAAVWDADVIRMAMENKWFLIEARVEMVNDAFAGVGIIVVAIAMISFEFVVTVAYSVDVPSDVGGDASINAFADVIMVFVSRIDIEVLNGAMATLEFFEVAKP